MLWNLATAKKTKQAFLSEKNFHMINFQVYSIQQGR